jgi:hypothetical protein
VPEPTHKLYRLTKDGKIDLDNLLYQVKCRKRWLHGREMWNRTELHDWTGLDEASINKVVKAVDPDSRCKVHAPVQERILLQLFQKLYKRTGISKSKQDFAGLWEEYPEDRPNKRPEELANFLTTLDYIDQSSKFDTRINRDYIPTAFFIPTPCTSTQKWAIHRLGRLIPNHDRAIRIPLIDVSSHPMRFNIDLLWDEIAQKLKVDRSDVLRVLSQQNVNRPVIIALHNFGADPDLTPQDVIEEFWNPLVEAIPIRTAGSRIILSIADIDEQFSSCKCNRVIKLPPLNNISITQVHVENWLNSPDVRKWCNDEFGKHWQPQTIANLSTWQWNKPSKILDCLCLEFGLKNGAQSLHKKWSC